MYRERKNCPGDRFWPSQRTLRPFSPWAVMWEPRWSYSSARWSPPLQPNPMSSVRERRHPGWPRWKDHYSLDRGRPHLHLHLHSGTWNYNFIINNHHTWSMSHDVHGLHFHTYFRADRPGGACYKYNTARNTKACYWQSSTRKQRSKVKKRWMGQSTGATWANSVVEHESTPGTRVVKNKEHKYIS